MEVRPVGQIMSVNTAQTTGLQRARISGGELHLTRYPEGTPGPADFRTVEVQVREPGPGES